MNTIININAILQDSGNENTLRLSDDTFDIMSSTVWKRVDAGTNGKDDWGAHWKLIVIPPSHSIASRKALNTSLPVLEGDYVAV